MTNSKNYDHPALGTVLFVKRKGQKSLRIRIKPNSIVVSMPPYTPYTVGLRFLNTKIDWVKEHQASHSEILSGMHIGKYHRLSFTESTKNSSRIHEGEIHVTGSEEYARKTIIRALKKEAETLITQRCIDLASHTHLYFNNLKFKHMTSRWGSCSSDKKLTFSVLLIQLPWHLIDYVIIHELCHTAHMNHSANFWKLVEEHCHDYKDRRKLLKKYQPQIFDTASIKRIG